MGSKTSKCCKDAAASGATLANDEQRVNVMALKRDLRNYGIDPRNIPSFRQPPLQGNGIVDNQCDRYGNIVRRTLIEMHPHFFSISDIPMVTWLEGIHGVDSTESLFVKLTDVQRKEALFAIDMAVESLQSK